MNIDVLDLVERGTAWMATKIDGTRRDQWTWRTPCDKFDVRALIQHCIGGAHHYAAIVRGEQIGWVYPDPFTDDPIRAYEGSRDDLLTSLRAPGALGEVFLGNVGEWPGAVHGALLFIDHMVHGWDLSIATEQDVTMPADLAESAWHMITDELPRPIVEGIDAARDPDGADGMFKPKVATADSATAQDKLVAFFGHRAS